MNLRGVRESGAAFAIPTYAFMFAIFGMVGYALFRISVRRDRARPRAPTGRSCRRAPSPGWPWCSWWLRAFSSGTTALTGVEAISNGVPAFRKPKSKNAATTLLMLGVISMTMFAAITWLALYTGVKVAEKDSDLIGLPRGPEPEDGHRPGRRRGLRRLPGWAPSSSPS